MHIEGRLEDLAIVRRLSEAGPAPPVLYHYTDRKGLLGIVETRSVHASNARYLNDAQELSFATSVAREVLGGRKPGDEAALQFLKDARNFLNGLGDPNHDVFVFSMSQDKDELSQWRAYSRPGDGYAVGFDPVRLARVELDAPSYLLPCEYDGDRHVALVEVVVGDAEKAMRVKLEAGEGPLAARAHGSSLFMLGFLLVAPVLKHPKFCREAEWRFVLPISSVWHPDIRFRDKGTLTVPYRPIRFPKKELPILEVVVGPTPHYELERRALSGLFTKAGLKSVSIGCSEIPFRAW